MPKQKIPERCKDCCLHHKAGHPKGSAMHGSKYDNWCARFCKHAPKALPLCINEEARLGRKPGYYSRVE
jgi:hypothetical protein